MPIAMQNICKKCGGPTRLESRYFTQSCSSCNRIEKLEAENAMLREALVRLRDCDWVISLPDRMDAVRDIARDALLGGGE